MFAVSDTLAVGAIKATLAAGKQVPEDLAVVGFDDVPLASIFEPSLHHRPTPALARRAGGTAAARAHQGRFQLKSAHRGRTRCDLQRDPRTDRAHAVAG